MTTEIAPDRTVTTGAARPDRSGTAPALDIVIPVYNEAHTIAHCVETLREYLDAELDIPARITIADNASTDDTLRVAHSLAAAVDDVRVVHLDAKGRGRALRRVWADSDARVLVYMDVDLSTDLKALHPLVAPLLSGHSDLAIGTRLGRGANVV
ncbi:glycosyltransferase, partial [Tsukamurella paurometabola]